MKRGSKLSEQVKSHVERPSKLSKKEGNTEIMISTGSTLLDLAISGGRVEGGGIPGGIMVEIFGPSGCGKTVLLSEIAGDIQRKGGDVMFRDPEARLNKVFARIFDVDFDSLDYDTPNTVTDVFAAINKFEGKGKINGCMTDSLAALSTDMEMDNDDGDKMGTRRAKEFSEGLRKNARIIQKNNILMVCSNQIRENMDAGHFGEKHSSPGGKAIGFYSSVRLRAFNPRKLKKKVKIKGKEVERVYGVQTQIEVYKNSVDAPYRTAPVSIIFDYGIDDIRENLQFLKTYTEATTYQVLGESLDRSLEKSILLVEQQGLEDDLKQEVIELWKSIEQKFQSERTKKKR
jgi:recombination protein RecA